MKSDSRSCKCTGTFDVARIRIAVDIARATAQQIVKAGEQAAQEIDRSAIHHILEARRVELRHGTLALVRASLQGFRALPAPKGKHWRSLLELDGKPATASDIEAAYKRLALKHHPDKGGAPDAMAELNVARQAALREVGK